MNDIKWAFRRIIRNKSTSLIHTCSLVAGICGFLFIFTYCYRQLTYDQYHGDLASMFRINAAWISEDEESLMTIAPGTISNDLKQRHPFIKAAGYVKLVDHNPLINSQNRNFETEDFYPANQDLLNVFRFDFIHGNKTSAFSSSSQLILSEKYATKIMGRLDCIGDFVKIKEKTYEVVGVFRNWPSNVDFNINGLYSTGSTPSKKSEFAYRTFVRVDNDAKAAELHQALEDLSRAYYQNNDEVKTNILFRPQNFKGLHFEPSLLADSPKGDLNFVYLYMLTGLVLFIIVLTNQINLNFVRNADLIKTYGIARILGSNKWKVRYQNLLENFLIFLFAVIISIALFRFILRTNIRVGDFSLVDLAQYPLVIAAIIIFYFVVTSIVSFLSTSLSLNNSPGLALRKEIIKNLPVGKFRDYLVLFQYTVGIVLVSTLLILYLQWDFIKNKDLGLQTDNIHVVDIISDSENEKLYYKLTDLFGSENVSTTQVDGKDVQFSTLSFPNKEHGDLKVNTIQADPTFLNIANIQLIQGTMPSHTDQLNFENGNRMPILINQALATRIEGRLGTIVNVDGWYLGRIVGVVEDFHYKSLHNTIEPLILFPTYSRFHPGPDKTISFLIRTEATESDIFSRIKSQVVPADRFQVHSMTDKVLENYSHENQAINLLAIFSGISVFVSLLGIVGMISYTMKKRKFEIGIRKILGAPLSSLLLLFGSRTLRMIVAAIVISYPIILFARSKILTLYAFDAEVGLLQLFIPAILLTLVTFFLIYALVRSSNSVNPTELIREE